MHAQALEALSFRHVFDAAFPLPEERHLQKLGKDLVCVRPKGFSSHTVLSSERIGTLLQLLSTLL